MGGDRATGLHLVANLCGARGSSKSDHEGFYPATLWLHAHHPHTLALNAASVAAFGYLKDLSKMLHCITHIDVSMKTPGKKVCLATEGGFIGRRRVHFNRRRPRCHAHKSCSAHQHDRGAHRG